MKLALAGQRRFDRRGGTLMGAEHSEQIYFNPWDEAYRANPYPYYEALYGRPPYQLNMFVPMVLVGRYRDAIAILHDHERFSSVPRMTPLVQERLELFGTAPRVVFSDPP